MSRRTVRAGGVKLHQSPCARRGRADHPVGRARCLTQPSGSDANEGDAMQIRFPSESAEYRTARDRLLERETDLRRAMEAVAGARRALPPGGAVPRDYLFAAAGPPRTAVQVPLSELFAPRHDSLGIYNL